MGVVFLIMLSPAAVACLVSNLHLDCSHYAMDFVKTSSSKFGFKICLQGYFISPLVHLISQACSAPALRLFAPQLLNLLGTFPARAQVLRCVCLCVSIS